MENVKGKAPANFFATNGKEGKKSVGKAKDKTGSGGKSTGSEANDNEKKTAVADEYEYDSSDEEDIRNTIGNIPVNW